MIEKRVLQNKRVFSEEHKQKLRDAHKGKRLTDEHKRNIAIANTGEKNWRWKGDRLTDGHGYVLIRSPEHRRASHHGNYVFEHILVYERFHHCCILDNAIIHHKNEIRNDNRIENLQGMSRRHHMQHHGIPKMRKPFNAKRERNKDSGRFISYSI